MSLKLFGGLYKVSFDAHEFLVETDPDFACLRADFRLRLLCPSEYLSRDADMKEFVDLLLNGPNKRSGALIQLILYEGDPSSHVDLTRAYREIFKFAGKIFRTFPEHSLMLVYSIFEFWDPYNEQFSRVVRHVTGFDMDTWWPLIERFPEDPLFRQARDLLVHH